MAKTKLTKKDIEHIAELVMMELTDEEIAKVGPQMEEILTYVAQLNELDTSKTESTHHVTGLENVLRKDEVWPSLSQEGALSNAAQTEDGYFKVPGSLSHVTA